MMRMKMAAVGLAIAALAATTGCASTRDGGMAGGDSMKSSMPMSMSMSPAEKEVMASCKAMSHDAMMQDAKCKQMMKMHAGMMKDGMMMKK